jgi:hypothetical protein
MIGQFYRSLGSANSRSYWRLRIKCAVWPQTFAHPGRNNCQLIASRDTTSSLHLASLQMFVALWYFISRAANSSSSIHILIKFAHAKIDFTLIPLESNHYFLVTVVMGWTIAFLNLTI